MVTTVSLVALGGAIGAACRYLAGVWIVHAFGKTGFPLAIISVNVIGSFAMGLFIVAAAHRGLTPYAPFVATGLLGGFTTFSAFSLETVVLIERGEVITAGAYVLLSVCVSVLALFLGMLAMRGLLP